MAFSLDTIQEEIITYLTNTAFPGQEVIETARPDAVTAPRDAAGNIKPFVTYRFGDIAQYGPRSFAGARGDDYRLPLYLECVAPTPEIARKLRNRAVDKMLGSTFTLSGDMRKTPGFGSLPVTNSDGAVEAYAYPTSFGILIQLDAAV